MYYIYEQEKNTYYPYPSSINLAKHIGQEEYERNRGVVIRFGWKIIRINDDGTKTKMS